MKILNGATKIFVLFLILFFVNSARSQTSDNIFTLPAGTRIYARMDNEINSKISSINDTFTVTVSAPVIIRDTEILSVGTIIEGRIVSVKSAGYGKRDGSFEAKFETLQLPNGAKRRIDAGLNISEKTASLQSVNIATIAGAGGIGALFGNFLNKRQGALIGAGVGLSIGTGAVLLKKGAEARIKSGEEISILLKRKVTLPVEDF